MTANDFFQVAFYVISLFALSPILGAYIAKVLNGKTHLMTKPLGWLEKGVYKISGVDENEEMGWKVYTKSLLIFNFIGFLFLFLILLFQNKFPLNPQNFSNLSWHLSLNTAISFMTNTNWQSYSGESTMSYFSQMLGLGVQNFLSAGTGIAVFAALVRGIARKKFFTIGNFWVDLTRSVVYILLPLSLIFAILLIGEGVIQNFQPYKEVITLEGSKQIIPGGPVASQVAIKQLGTNGGGFFNANSSHPFENPTPFSNFLEMLAILLIPAALTFSFGRMIGSLKQGWILFMVMLSVWLGSLAISTYFEYFQNPTFSINEGMEGKEVRFGVINSLVWSSATTVASNGSVNTMHSSLSPMAGGMAMFNIMLGEIIFGGVGSGMYGMLLFVILTVFLSGLMVGRSPEYLGKKIEAYEIKWVIIGILGPCAAILIGSAVSCVIPIGLSSLLHKGPHGFSEILYAFTSAAGNNGSAFAGLNANVPYYNTVLGLCMLIGRFVVIIPVLAVAGSLACKKIIPASSGTFTTDSFIFVVLLFGVIFIVGALTFLPALSLGPIVEHFLMLKGKAF